MKKMTIVGIFTIILFITNVNAQTFSVTPDTSDNVSANSFDGIVAVVNADSGLKVFCDYRIVGAAIWTSLSGLQTVAAGNYSLTFPFTGLTANKTYEWRSNYKKIGQSPVFGSVVLTVTLLGPPTFTTQPSNQTVNSGADVTFTAIANGNPSLISYQWYKNSAVISGAINSVLSLTGVTSSDAGSYQCKASNSEGTVSSSVAVLTVKVAPVISSQPQSASVNPGSNVTFSVTTSSGTAPLSYQWKKVGVGLVGTASSFTINSVVSSDAGDYYVIVSNSVGSDTSNTATLSVAALVPTINTTSIVVTPNTSGGSISAQVNGNYSETTVRLFSALSGFPLDSSNWVNIGSGLSTVNFSVSGFEPCEAIDYKIEAQNDAGSVVTGLMTFNTSLVAPTGINQNVALTDITSSSLVMTGYWESNGSCGSASTSGQLLFGKNQSSLVPEAWQNMGVGNGTITASKSGLSSSTTYYYQWKFKNQSGMTTLTNVLSATTSEGSTTPSATLIIMGVSYVGGTTAKVEFKLQSNVGIQLKAVNEIDSLQVAQGIGNESAITTYGSTPVAQNYVVNISPITLKVKNYVALFYMLDGTWTWLQTPVKVFDLTSVDVEETSASEILMKVYPNPARSGDAVTLESSTKGILKIFNITGQEILEQEIAVGINQLQLNISDIYFCKLSSSKGIRIVKLAIQDN